MGFSSVSKFLSSCYNTNPLKSRVFREFQRNLQNSTIFAQIFGIFVQKNLIFNSKTFSKLFNFSKITFLCQNFFFKICLKFFFKILPIFEFWKIFMHKNAIKKVRGVKFLEILAKNSCFSRVLGLFGSCFLCHFGSTIVFFKKKFLVTLMTHQSIFFCQLANFDTSMNSLL